MEFGTYVGSAVGRVRAAGRRPKPFVHLLATRIGIGVYDPGWVDYRLRLFESITVPSMKAQTCQDFTWLLVVDREMPAESRFRLEAAIADMGNAVVTPVEFKSDLKDTVVAWARRLAAERGVEYVMTSRLDDDDAMRVDSFERLHEEAWTFTRVSTYDCALFSFNIGCMWLPSQRLGYTRYHDSHSLSLSLVELAALAQGIYSRRHVEIKQQFVPRGAYVRGIDGDTRWWLYATHALADSDTGDDMRVQKVLNHKYGYHVDDDLLRTFGLDPVVIQELEDISEPKAQKPVLRMWTSAQDVELEIQQLRAELSSAAQSERLSLQKRIDELERKRREAGSGFVTR